MVHLPWSKKKDKKAAMPDVADEYDAQQQQYQQQDWHVRAVSEAQLLC